MNRKNPVKCNSVDEIRTAIDQIDREIFLLFAERHKYVEEIVKFKTDEEGVVARERKIKVIQQRIEWAEELGLNPATFKEIYQLLIESNIKHELKLLKAKK